MSSAEAERKKPRPRVNQRGFSGARFDMKEGLPGACRAGVLAVKRDHHPEARSRSFSRYRRADAAGMITGAQMRAARKLLGWPRDRLCPRAGLSVTMLRKIEDGLRTPTNEQRLGIQGALEAAGVEFTNGDEPGVKLKATKMN